MADMLNNKKLKENKFVVPEGYFDTFEQELYQHLSLEMSSRKRNKGLILNHRYITSIAAAIIVILVTGWLLVQQQSQSQEFANFEYLLIGDNLSQYYYEPVPIETSDWDTDSFLYEELDEPLLLSMLNN